MDIQKMYDDSRRSSYIKDRESLEKKLRLYVNGGYQGLKDIYYNYYTTEKKIKFKNITPFEDFINTNDVENFYFNEVFFEVDNKYITNIGCFIYVLCNHYINSDKSNKNKQVDLISVVNRLEHAISNSAVSLYSNSPNLYNVLKKIENYYLIVYNNLYDDFAPFLKDRPHKRDSNDMITATTQSVNHEPFETPPSNVKTGRNEILNILFQKESKSLDTFIKWEDKLITYKFINSDKSKWLKGAAEFIRFYVFCEKNVLRKGVYEKNTKGVKHFRNLYDFHDGDTIDVPNKRKKQITLSTKNEFDFLNF